MKSSRIVKENGPVPGALAPAAPPVRIWFAGRLAFPFLAALAIGLLGGASCKKDSNAANDPKAVIAAADAAKGGAVAEVDRTPVSGVDVSKLDAAKQERFFKLVGAMPSPCGKAHSLRTSVSSDPSCKRAAFAARLIAELIADEQSDEIVRDFYEERYVKNAKVHPFKTEGAPSHGSSDAPVTLVEFFDYGCPACVQMKPVLDQVVQENRGKVKVVYKMYPLPKHPDSMGAAQAVLAAHAQGKFLPMHDIVFEKFGAQKKDELKKYAQQIGLDMARYDADFAAAEALVKADLAEGEAEEVDGTPSLFVNGRKYPGPADPKYFTMAIEEELATRR